MKLHELFEAARDFRLLSISAGYRKWRTTVEVESDG